MRPASLRASPPPDALQDARAAGLRYVSDAAPGIRRVGAPGRFQFRHDEGRRIQDPETLNRIRRLAIPPAWQEVWICPRPDGHLQATGRDARGRKQYRYHPDWRAVRDENKYERTLTFGQALPRIRQRVARDLRRPGLGRDKILATIVRLLETTLVRVGNEEYARTNGSVGLTTMRDRHVRVRRGTLRFAFKGKSGQHHDIELRDPHLARIVRRAQDLPGQELFQYVDANGQQQTIHSEDVNGYLREIAGAEFSAKDFRTWAGTVLAAVALAGLAPSATKREAKRNVTQAITRVAQRLGNTPTVCRKCYIHPVILSSYLAGETVGQLRAGADALLQEQGPRLSPEERTVLRFLRHRLRQPPAPSLGQALRASLSAAARSPRPAIVSRRRPRGARGGDARGATTGPRRRSRSAAPRSRRA
ncbi:DNA topoisomerase IB [Opitutus sp. ER46]|uniref:DNA topoisomerase IB n=1 Tax=Opitutus sp. ER46 TaxID=2161864 RepID=UPI000D322554|nr:DNA topoisomerase IB [Opitutus sp. ER46]PTX92361.1 DNA topoisomerase I [Opitutus sp. ER46]